MSPTVSDYEVMKNEEEGPAHCKGSPASWEVLSVHSLGDRDWGLVSVCNPYPIILRGLSNCAAHLTGGNTEA